MVLSYASFAQEDETMRIFKSDHSEWTEDTLWTAHEKPTLVIIPFEPMMYRSQIDRSIGQNDGTNFEQIRDNFRISLDNLLFIENDQKYSVVRMLSKEEEIKKDLYYLYSSTSQDYRVVPKENEEPKKKSLNLKMPLNKRKKEEEEAEKKHGTYIENGQIQSHNDGQERFMARSVRDSAMFDFMYNKYGAVIYVFINQFDIGPMPGLDYRSFESEEYQREIRVHYSVFTHKSEIYAGVAKTWFSSRVNTQKDIIMESMPALATDIGTHIPVMVSQSEQTQ